MRLCAWLVVAAALTAATAGCRSTPAPGRVIVLGLDGVDPDVVDLLVSEGAMPNFARLRERGASGRLLSRTPLLSPVVWTTIATGKTPEEHRIGHFVAVNEQTGERLPVTSQMRRGKALWNILSDAGRQVDVVGWWATWPAETVKGTIVSDHACYHFLLSDRPAAADSAGIVSPPAMESQIESLVRKPADLTATDLAPFLRVTPEELARPFDFNDDVSHFKWALAAAESYRRIGLFLWERERPDQLMVYIEATDSASHLFGHLFRATGLAGELAAQQERAGGAVAAMYRYADALVGDYLAAMDDRTTLVVLSDHGFELGRLPDDPSALRDMRRVSEQSHRMEGILYVYGRGAKPGARFDRPSILDIAPTLLALHGLAPARDMPGRVLTEGLTLAAGARTTESYDGGPATTGGAAADPAVDPAILEHLRSLGYLDAQSPKGDRNLAAMHFQAGRYAEAAAAYETLLQREPTDGNLHASLGGVYGALGRFDEALEHLRLAEQFEPLNPETYHNRAAIYERQGRREAAIEAYREALRYQPLYEPSRAALARLGVSPAARTPPSDAERQAVILAQRAGDAARRGDYAAAMRDLDAAEQLAPNAALVHHYRANVAFLMGDRDRAAAALRRALEIEPDNALFRRNLERLQR